MGGGGTDVRAAGEWVEGVCSVESDKWRVCCDPLHTASASPPPPHTFSSSGPSASNSRAQRSAPPSPSVPGPLPCRVSHSWNAPTFRRKGEGGRHWVTTGGGGFKLAVQTAVHLAANMNEVCVRGSEVWERLKCVWGG